MRVRPIAASVYALMLALLLIVGLFGYIVWSNREHDRKLAQLSLTRQEESNEFFMEVCDRFEIRDDIFLSILQGSYLRALQRHDGITADSLESSIIALRQAQGDCRRQIPRVRKPPDPKP